MLTDEQLPPWPILTLGVTGFPVQPMQYLLQYHNADCPLGQDYNYMVEEAVKEFQRMNGLEDDGICGPQTWSKLAVALQEGDRGQAVRGLQDAIQFWNQADGEEAERFPVKVDGIFGPKTRGWVQGFQEVCELKVDGIVGWRTWRCILVGMYSG